jgi:U32 family peptidase
MEKASQSVGSKTSADAIGGLKTGVSANRPDILAPAGNRASFLAAIAAGADAVYCGLQAFSARMEAKNFTLEELASLVDLARHKGVKVYVTVNSLLKPDELTEAGRTLELLHQRVQPAGIIVQDLALIPLVRQTGFRGQIHLSTLANVSFPQALAFIGHRLGVERIVIPRELHIDEIKQLAAACPPGIELEVFVHGALCYAVSGRCYWSSFLGGKSGLRGRCVQPCRRVYVQGDQRRRLFSCRDLSLDVLVKVLLETPRVAAWKIEGRKKGPHYVYYTVRGYQLLRDHGTDPQVKKDALYLLAHALGREGTHYHFLPQRPQNPIPVDAHTGSGLLVGKVKGSRQASYLTPRQDLLPGDVLRIGYEDDAAHALIRVGRAVPKGGRFNLKSTPELSWRNEMPVFLTDRREKALDDMISRLEDEVETQPGRQLALSSFTPRLPRTFRITPKTEDYRVYRRVVPSQKPAGLWLSEEALKDLGAGKASAVWWWLLPVIWPAEEQHIVELIDQTRRNGGCNYVLNAPWQAALLASAKGIQLWAGPFCNATNPLALETLAALGFTGVIVSPELSRDDYLQLPQHSPVPLGVVTGGNWPLCLSRILASPFQTDTAFTSPRGEQAWVSRHGSNYWTYPNWQLDLTAEKTALRRAGYRMFVHLVEPVPQGVNMKPRKGKWNWDLELA